MAIINLILFILFFKISNNKHLYYKVAAIKKQLDIKSN